MTGQRGFTLVEVVVAGIISMVLAGVALSTLFMANDLISSGALSYRLSQYSAVVTDQISRTTRSAYMVKGSGDTPSPITGPYVEPFHGNQSQVVFCSRLGDTLGGYAVDAGGYLKEMKNGMAGWAFRAFEIGEDTVRIYAATSEFSLLANRAGVDFRLHFYIADGGDTVKFPVHIEKVLCRNVDL